MPKQQIKMRVICVDPMRQCLDAETIAFGLQDKQGNLQPGQALSPDEIGFDFALAVSRHSDGSANFTGPYAQGSRATRFVYLTYKIPEGDDWRIYRRIKAPLHSISWGQVAAALAADQTLQARVSGLRSGTAPLLDGGWLAVD